MENIRILNLAVAFSFSHPIGYFTFPARACGSAAVVVEATKPRAYGSIVVVVEATTPWLNLPRKGSWPLGNLSLSL